MTSIPNFRKIAIQCDGMLSPAIYQHIYEAARTSEGGLMVEVGTAHGAATVALALGLRDSGRSGRVVTFGRGHLEIVKRNLRDFGVENLVEVVMGDVGDTASAVPHSAKISVLMLDADGRIDRDFIEFFNRVVPQGVVIIDDCVDVMRFHRTGFSSMAIDAKMRLTYLLLSYFKSKGIISMGCQLRHTYFGEKLCNSPYEFDLTEILEVYRQLIFTSAKATAPESLRRVGLRFIKAISPALAQRLRVQYRSYRENSKLNTIYCLVVGSNMLALRQMDIGLNTIL
ncbi:class I SAM-dependent methyltransferase [Microvirga sp. P5_D2]